MLPDCCVVIIDTSMCVLSIWFLLHLSLIETYNLINCHSDLIVFLTRMIVGYITPEASLIHEEFWQEWLLCCWCIFSFVSIQSSVFDWLLCFFWCVWLRWSYRWHHKSVNLLHFNCWYHCCVEWLLSNCCSIIMIPTRLIFIERISSFVDCCDITFPIALIAYPHQS